MLLGVLVEKDLDGCLPKILVLSIRFPCAGRTKFLVYFALIDVITLLEYRPEVDHL